MNLQVFRAPKDERTIAVAHASSHWAYQVLAFGLLIDVAFRRPNNSWDIMALLVISGLVATVYQARNRTLPWRQLLFASLAIIPLQVIVAYLLITFALR